MGRHDGKYLGIHLYVLVKDAKANLLMQVAYWGGACSHSDPKRYNVATALRAQRLACNGALRLNKLALVS